MTSGVRPDSQPWAIIVLHQGASLSMDEQENVADVFWLPLLVCIAGFILLFVTMVLLRTRTEIRSRRLKALLARERVA